MYFYATIDPPKTYGCVYRNESESSLIKPFECRVRITTTSLPEDSEELGLWDLLAGGEQTQWVVDYLEEMLEGTFILSPKDSLLNFFTCLENSGVFDLRMMDCASPNCFAKVIYDDLDPIVRLKSKGLVWINRVVLRSEILGMGYNYQYENSSS